MLYFNFSKEKLSIKKNEWENTHTRKYVIYFLSGDKNLMKIKRQINSRINAQKEIQKVTYEEVYKATYSY